MIENLSSGAKAIALAELGDTDKRNAIEIVGNVHAMQGDVERIVAKVAEASFAAITNARQLVADINDIRARWDAAVGVRRNSLAWRVADFATRQPVFDAETVAREFETTSANASRSIAPLVEAGC